MVTFENRNLMQLFCFMIFFLCVFQLFYCNSWWFRNTPSVEIVFFQSDLKSVCMALLLWFYCSFRETLFSGVGLLVVMDYPLALLVPLPPARVLHPLSNKLSYICHQPVPQIHWSPTLQSDARLLFPMADTPSPSLQHLYFLDLSPLETSCCLWASEPLGSRAAF